MKKTLFALLAVLLVAIMAVALVACGEVNKPTVNPDDPTTDVSAFKAKGEWTTINDPLTWEGINAFKSTDEIAKLYETDKNAAIAEARQLCVDFFRYSKTALWIANEDFSYWHMKKDHEANTPTTLNQQAGMVCGGVPYIYVGSGSIYRLMDYMDPTTNVVDMSFFQDHPHLYGNQCSIGSYWGWARIINSCDYAWTQDIVESKGFPRVGDYEYELLTSGWSDGYRTTQVLEANGAEKMYECYAQLKAGDGIVYYTTAGHVVMISKDAHVERDEEGKIIPGESYVFVIDQTPTEMDGVNQAGDKYIYEKNVDSKWDFVTLFKGNYVPFTYKEWTGEDPIEKVEAKVNHTGDTITYDQIYKLKMTSNYGISDFYVEIRNANGVEVWKSACRATQAGVKELKYTNGGSNIAVWGDFEKLDPANYEYTVKIYAQLGTGDRPVLWEGKLAAGE